jgi:hypothetical protein
MSKLGTKGLRALGGLNAVDGKPFAYILSFRNFNWTFASLVYEDSEYGVKVLVYVI